MKIVIAPRNLHRSLLTILRTQDPFCDVKLISKSQLEKYVYPSVKEEAILFLMKSRNYSYEVADTLLEFVPYIDNDKSNPKFELISEIRKELENHELLFQPLENNIFKNQPVEIYGYYNEDSELTYLFKKLNLTPTYHKNDKRVVGDTLYQFNKVEEETYYVLNEIAHLIDSGVSPKDILIYRRNDVYDYYLNKFAPLFGYKINMPTGDSFFSQGGSKAFFKFYKETKDIEQALIKLKELMKEDDTYLDIANFVNDNVVEEIPFEIQFDYLINKFLVHRLPVDKYEPAINVISSPVIEENKHVFVMGFAQGQFPKSLKDAKYLNNVELNDINRLNVKEVTKLDEISNLDFFYSNNNFIFSFSSKSIKLKFFPSPLVKVLSLEDFTPKLARTFYSEKTLKYIYTNLKDMNYFYKENGVDFRRLKKQVSIDYDTYDSEFNGKDRDLHGKDDLCLSTTQLDLYGNCPYHYYLNKILNLEEIEDSFYMTLGNIAHHMFQHCFDKNFDFEREFANKIGENPLKPSEIFLLETNLKNQIKLACDVIKKREQYQSNSISYQEKDMKMKIDDQTMVVGRIDYLAVIDQEYVICIDYKTGSTKFNDKKLENGVYTQLPTYALLLSEDKEFKDYKIAGIYINNVIDKGLTNILKEGELIPAYLKLNGKTINEINVISKIDSTIADKKSSFISGISIKKDGGLASSSGLVFSTEFDGYKNTALELYKNVANAIRNNQFPISPIFFSDNDNACQYCEYKDICHVKEAQYRKVEGGEEDEQN